MFSSHNSCLTTKVSGPAVKLPCACVMSGKLASREIGGNIYHHRTAIAEVEMPGFGRCYAVSAGMAPTAEHARRPYRLLAGAGIAKYQSLDPDLFLHLQARCAP